MKCPICGGAELVHDTRDVPFVYKGIEAMFPGVEGDFCSSCGEIILDMNNAIRVSSLTGDFMEDIYRSENAAGRPCGV